MLMRSMRAPCFPITNPASPGPALPPTDLPLRGRAGRELDRPLVDDNSGGIVGAGCFRVMGGLARFRGALASLRLAAAQIDLERRRESLAAGLPPRRARARRAAG